MASDDIAKLTEYVQKVYGPYTGDAVEAVASFWFERWDSQLRRIEDMGYEPFSLRPLCAVADDFAFRQIRLKEVNKFVSFLAEEELLTEAVKLTGEEVDRLVKTPAAIYIDRPWCQTMEDTIRQQYKDLPPP